MFAVNKCVTVMQRVFFTTKYFKTCLVMGKYQTWEQVIVGVRKDVRCRKSTSTCPDSSEHGKVDVKTTMTTYFVANNVFSFIKFIMYIAYNNNLLLFSLSFPANAVL